MCQLAGSAEDLVSQLLEKTLHVIGAFEHAWLLLQRCRRLLVLGRQHIVVSCDNRAAYRLHCRLGVGHVTCASDGAPNMTRSGTMVAASCVLKIST